MEDLADDNKKYYYGPFYKYLKNKFRSVKSRTSILRYIKLPVRGLRTLSKRNKTLKPRQNRRPIARKFQKKLLYTEYNARVK